MLDRGPITPFRLKEFLTAGPAAKANGSLSSSFAELTTLTALAELDPTLMDRLASFNGAYPLAHGSPELCEAIAGFLGLEPGDVIVTNGADDAIDLIYRGLLVPGDVLSLVDPAYGPLRSLAQQQGARVTGVPLDEPSGWSLTAAGWNQLLSGGPRLVALNLPHNPTGWMPDPAALDDLLARARRTDTLVLFDEIYAGLDHQSTAPFRSLAAEHPETITVGSLSKAFGLPGLRIGWVASRRSELIARLKTLRMHANAFVSGLSEVVAPSALRNAERILSRNLSLARANRQELLAFGARRPDRWSLQVHPRGVLAFARWLGPGTSSELSARALEALGLLVVPGPLVDFGDQHVRFGYGTADFTRNLAAFEAFLDSRY